MNQSRVWASFWERGLLALTSVQIREGCAFLLVHISSPGIPTWAIFQSATPFEKKTTLYIILSDKKKTSTMPDAEEKASQVILFPGAEDHWAGITDPRERRKIQNRLAQRAYRKFLVPDI